MAGIAGNTPTPQDQDVLDKAIAFIDKVGTLGAAFTGNPILMAGVELLGKGIRSWASERGIDTGPFDAHMASIDATVAQGRSAYAEYLKRHGGTAAQV